MTPGTEQNRRGRCLLKTEAPQASHALEFERLLFGGIDPMTHSESLIASSIVLNLLIALDKVQILL
jgi:hypothetical protein